MERRRAIRRSVSPDEPLGRARLRTGGQLRIIDASNWGALVGTKERLLPGRHLDVHIVSAEGRVLVRCRVARAWVVKVEPDAVHYQAAFAFEREVDLGAAGYVLPSSFRAAEMERGSRYPDRPVSSEIEFAEHAAAEQIPVSSTVASRLVEPGRRS